MNQDTLSRMVGEWIGSGEMTVGSLQGAIEEYMRIEATDIPTCLSYVRKSRITFPSRITLHNELGYLKPSWIGLFLSRGSHIILTWDELGYFKQIDGSDDSRNMIRKIEFPNSFQMVWDNDMEVKTDRGWFKHTAVTKFTSVTRVTTDEADIIDTFAAVPA